MNQIELRKLLMTVTPHEKNYRNGLPNSSKQYFDTVITNGQEALFITFSQSKKYLGDALFGVKQHSRFQKFPLHFHDYVEINYMYAGSCQQIINGVKHSLKTGQVLLMDAKTVHTIEPLGEEDILLNIFISKKQLTANFFNRFSSDSLLVTFFLNTITEGIEHDNYIIFKSEDSHRLHLFLNEFLAEWYDPSIVSRDISESLLSLIISELVIIYQNDYAQSADNIRQTPILPILRYIEEHYRNCTLTETAAKFNLNKNYLSNLLKKHTGSSYKQLVIEQRLKMAEQLLNTTNLSIREIAHSIGFENISFFYDKFQQKYGQRPGEHRLTQIEKPSSL